MTEYIGRGGKREGAGRPKGSVKPDANKTKNRTIGLTDSEYAEYMKRGGAKWLRANLRGEENG